MSSFKKYTNRPLTLSQQGFLLDALPETIRKCTIKKGTLTTCFKIRPTDLSRTYRVKITYKLTEVPKVMVIEPNLVDLANGKKLPHVYHNPLRLCLFTPKLMQWNSTMKIAKTTVPWTYLWLYYFEDWLESGVWKGGGILH